MLCVKSELRKNNNMPLYKEISPICYDEELRAVFKLSKNRVSIPSIIMGEKLNIETSINNGNERVNNYKIIVSSPLRIKPKCEVFTKCGGCALQHLVYQQQLLLKDEVIKKLFSNIINSNTKVYPIIGMDFPYHYRNKSQVVFKYKNGKNISGFYEEGTHEVINFDNCYLQNELSNKIFKTIKELIIKMHISIYDEDKKTGIIRHILIKTAKNSEALVVIITGSSFFPGKNNFVKALTSRHPEIKSIIHNINGRSSSAVLGNEEEVIYGKGYIIDDLLGYKFKITSKSFYQINHLQTEVMYQKVIDFAKISSQDVVLDAYCGVGTIGILASKYAKKVIGVELVNDAVDNARYNAQLNKIKNISFFCQDASNFIINMARRKEKIDVVIMDPPRSGSTNEFLQSVLLLHPSRIVYVSCNPYTLVNDLKVLLNDYQIEIVQPVDMFPETYHIETITLLGLKEPKK